MTANYVVIDETNSIDITDPDLAPPPAPKKKKESKSIDDEAESMAKLMEDMASEAAKIAVVSALKEGEKIKAETIKSWEKDIKRVNEKLLELERARPVNLCMHVKIGDLATIKLKQRAAKILPELIAQAKIAQSGGKWPLVYGPTGSGKTVAASQVAESLGLPFDHLNCSQGMSETWIWGRQTPNGFVAGGPWKAYTQGGVFLFDEIDAMNDNVGCSAHTLLGSREAHNPISGETAKRHKDCIFIAAANTNGKGGTGAYTGRSRLDAATLNRFSLYEMGYDLELERELCLDKKLLEVLWDIRSSLQEKNSQDVISTRDILDAYLQSKAGYTLEKILGCLKLRMDKANHALFEAKGKKK